MKGQDYEYHRRQVNRLLMCMGRFDPQSLKYEVLRKELVWHLDQMDKKRSDN